MVLTNLMEIDAHFAKWRRELSLHFAGLCQCFSCLCVFAAMRVSAPVPVCCN